jgi:hypothetical protein
MGLGGAWLVRRLLGRAGPPDELERDGAFLLVAILAIIAVAVVVRAVKAARRRPTSVTPG